MDLNYLTEDLGPMKPIIEIFLSYLITTGPFILVALTISSIISRAFKEKWVEGLAVRFGHIWLFRLTILPFISLLSLTNPSCYEVGRLLKEKHKPSFYDATVSFCHPITALFPYSNSGELFFLIGALYPLLRLQLPLWNFAIVYFLTGFLVILIRGTTTQFLTQKYIRDFKNPGE